MSNRGGRRWEVGGGGGGGGRRERGELRIQKFSSLAWDAAVLAAGRVNEL